MDDASSKEQIDVVMNSNDVVATSTLMDASSKEKIDVVMNFNDAVDTSSIVVFTGLSSFLNKLYISIREYSPAGAVQIVCPPKKRNNFSLSTFFDL
ncbi:hypothetical protein L1887_20419 [Cichorium endivia]|nr:hypothetical protein L1887_20419 [Cichorium endivia]